MRKNISIIFSIIFAFTMLSSNSIFAIDDGVWKDSETRNIYISDGVSFEGVFNTGKETKKVLQDDSEQYSKKVNIRGEFIKNPENEIILCENLEVTFNYNNVKAWIENPLTDIVRSNHTLSDPKWKVTNNEEIYVSPGQCIVSQQSALYKKAGWFNIRKSWTSAGNFHADIVCSANGEIKFNSESLGKLTRDEFTFKNVSTEEKLLQDNVTRITNIIDDIYYLDKDNQNNQEKDKYNYVTRQIEVTYLDSEKNLIASTLMQINFRYNTKTKEVECVSTSHRENVPNNRNSMEVYVRTGDKTRNYGGAYGEIKIDISMIGKLVDVLESVVASCDYNGNIVSEITTK